MAEEDKIDILSEFNLDNLLPKSETEIYDHGDFVSNQANFSNCDCSAPWSSCHTGHSFWDSGVHSDYGGELSQEHLYSFTENVVASNLTSADLSGWTETEKGLIQQGIEIFGKNSVRLSQFIGSKTSYEVKMYLKNVYSENETMETMCEEIVIDDNAVEEFVIDANAVEEFVIDDNAVEEFVIDDNAVEELNNVQNDSDSVFLDDTEIPASIEEVIAAVTTAEPTVPFSSFKSNTTEQKWIKRKSNKYKDTSTNSLLKKKMDKLFRQRNDKHLKMVNRKRQNDNPKQPSKMGHCRKDGIEIKKCKITPNDSNSHTLEDTSKAENITNTNVISCLNGEEVIKMKKEVLQESESDIDVDVESCNSDIKEETSTILSTKKPEDAELKGDNRQLSISMSKRETNENVGAENFSGVSKEVLQQLTSLEVPKNDLLLEYEVISDLEKCINKEFFCGRPTKTPQRYLKIRNHILSMWSIAKPAYVTKTSARYGLKHCGDVNSISRVHLFLEQIGAINFGCDQLNYIRPLTDLFLLERVPPVKEKVLNLPLPKPMLLNRNRIKKKFTNDGEGGFTITHNENGDIISSTFVNNDSVVKRKPYNKKPVVRLIYCKLFNDEHPQPYNIILHLTPLLLMDFHAHTSHSEVMGLIGGNWNSESKSLVISHYVPCQNIATSATHCEMCPISQANAADILHSKELSILGWFHSHPTFAPEPSQQDLDTQLAVQKWIGVNQPCVGLILSPFSAHGALIASPYRCLIVDKKSNFEDQYVPYKFKIQLVSSSLDIDDLLNQAWCIYNKNFNTKKVNFKHPYFLDSNISYLDKFISSVKMHLAKCVDINKMSCDSIISGISRICLDKPN